MSVDLEVSNSSILSAFAAHQRITTYGANATVFDRGSQPDGIHVLLAGDVDLQFTRNDRLEPLRLRTAGLILGLSSLVSGRPHEYTAVTRSEVITGFIDRDTFFRVLHSAPALWFNVLQVLSQDIASCYERVKSIAAPAVRR